MERKSQDETQIVTQGVKRRKPPSSVATKTEDDKKNNCDFGQNITYDVLRIILKKLNNKDLSKAAMVCKSWQEAARKENKTRREPAWFILHPDNPKTEKICLSMVADDLYIKPKVALVFAGDSKTSFWCSSVGSAKDCCCLNVHCEIISLCNYGVIGETNEVENGETALSCLCLPEIPNVKMRTFHYYKEPKNYSMLCNTDDDLMNIKSIIMFSNENGSDIARSILGYFVYKRSEKSQEKIAIWGGITNELARCEGSKHRKMRNSFAFVAGISICGSGISAWSIVLDRTVRTKEQVEKKLAILKSNVLLRKYSVGLMFACCGRGVRMFKEKNVESTIFRKLFPNVPLVGSFGGGEFGNTTIPDVPRTSEIGIIGSSLLSRIRMNQQMGLSLNLVLLVVAVGAGSADPGVWDSGLKNKYDGYGEDWIFMPDGNGHPQVAVLKGHEPETRGMFDFAPISFILHTRNGPENGTKLFMNKTEILKKSNFSPSRQTKFITHGWKSSASSIGFRDMKDAFLAHADYNVILVDWEPLAASTFYLGPMQNTGKVGKEAARFIDFVVAETGAKTKDFHFIGHSLGAHVAGNTGHFTTTGQLGRVTGLDPALPGFHLFSSTNNRLDPTDAIFVDVIHSCGGVLGYFQPLGHADFYPNGGTAMQPGCCCFPELVESCSHGRSYVYFTESINSKTGFQAVKCDTWDYYVKGNCSRSDTTLMGEHVDRKASGSYFLKTRSESPFPYVEDIINNEV